MERRREIWRGRGRGGGGEVGRTKDAWDLRDGAWCTW